MPAIRALFRERKDVAGLEGAVDTAVIVTHEDEDSERIDELQHNHQDAITTQLHDHMDGRKCSEVLVLHAEAERVKELYNSFQASDEVEQAKIIIP